VREGRGGADGPLIVAIDGPAGAGKSTLAKRLAERFGLLNIETGAMYRAFALKALAEGVESGDAAGLAHLAERTSIRLEPGPAGNRVFLDGAEVTERLRSAEVTAAASEVSVHPAIRRWMVEMQRRLGERGRVVMEGRDIGTAVFPQAQVKIFLDASPEKRGERRFEQVQGQAQGQVPGQAGGQGAGQAAGQAGDGSIPAAVLAEIRERDRRDRTRADSPLRPAEDAVLIDSTELGLEEVVARAARLVQGYLDRENSLAEQGTAAGVEGGATR
jgi:cytidylate kinase